MADPQTPNFEEQRDLLREINAELGRQIDNVRDASKEYALEASLILLICLPNSAFISLRISLWSSKLGCCGSAI